MTQVNDADVSLVPVEIGGLTVYASVPELMGAEGDEEGRSTSFPRLVELKVPSGGYRAAIPTVADPPLTSEQLPGEQQLNPWPWQSELNPLLLMLHSYEDKLCLTVNGEPGAIPDPLLGQLLGRLTTLSTRSLEDPLVLLTCAEGTSHQELADATGHLVLYPDGKMGLVTWAGGQEGRADAAWLLVGRPGVESARFRSAYPQGPAGDRVRWASRRRFASSATDWVVEHRADPKRPAPAEARPMLFGGGRGLAYFDRRDRASRAAVLESTMPGTGYVALTPNDDYRPGAPAGTAAARPWDSRELGELPFGLEGAAVAATYYADGRFAVYDEQGDLSYWETPEDFGPRLRRDVVAASDGNPAREAKSTKVVLLTDFSAVPPGVREEVASRAGLEVVTVNAPATLVQDQDQGSPRTRIALLPRTSDATVPTPEWTSTTPAGSSTTLVTARWAYRLL